MIRLACEHDVHACYQLMCELEECTFDEKKFEEIYLNDLHSKQHICFVDEENHQVEGLIHLRIEEQWHHVDQVCEIMELVVSSNARGKKIGSRLIQKAEEFAMAQNCCVFELTTNQKRVRAHQFYEKKGLIQTHFKYTKEIKK